MERERLDGAVILPRHDAPVPVHGSAADGQTVVESLAETVEVTMFGEFGVTDLIALRAEMRGTGPALTIGHFILAALSRTLGEHPTFNAHFTDDTMHLLPQADIGFAVSLDNGDLISPVLRDVAAVSLDGGPHGTVESDPFWALRIDDADPCARHLLSAHDGHWHGLEGEEATITGVYFGLRHSDVVAPHYRGAVSAALAKGADLRTIMAGCLGQTTAYHKGRHLSDICGPPEFGLIGLYVGSLGPPLGYAAGAVLAAKLDGRDDIAVGAFGDGSSSRGDCHETMNFAAVLSLPMVFVCQNNQIAISTEVSAGVAGSIAARRASFGMPCVEVDGNDVIAVRDAMGEAVARTRGGGDPSTISCTSYRVAGRQDRGAVQRNRRLRVDVRRHP